MSSSQLLDRTLDLVRNRPKPVTYEQIEIDTGVPKAWLKLLVAGEVKHPCVKRVETLYVYFTKQPLTLV